MFKRIWNTGILFICLGVIHPTYADPAYDGINATIQRIESNISFTRDQIEYWKGALRQLKGKNERRKAKLTISKLLRKRTQMEEQLKQERHKKKIIGYQIQYRDAVNNQPIPGK